MGENGFGEMSEWTHLEPQTLWEDLPVLQYENAGRGICGKTAGI